MSGGDLRDRGDQKEKGSPQPGEPLYLAVGQLRRPHGIDGEIIMDVMTDFPERLRRGKVVFVGEDYTRRVLRGVRQHPHGLLVAFKEYDSAETVGELRNQLVYVKADSLPGLPEGEYYHHQLIGLEVVDEQDRRLGALESILETGANDVYIVRGDQGDEILFPAIADVVLKVDLEKRQMVVRPQEYR